MEKKPWQIAENEKPDDAFDRRSFEANGYPADDTLYPREDDETDEKNDENDDSGDWGNVDPQSHPNPPGTHDPMDPSGPGSAV